MRGGLGGGVGGGGGGAGAEREEGRLVEVTVTQAAVVLEGRK